jgi:hypothetical protein
MLSFDYEKLVEKQKVKVEQPVDVIALLSDISDRTLLYGFTCDRLIFHVYIKNKKVVKYIYSYYPHDVEILVSKSHLLSTLVPNKRVYPETCDRQFCELLIDRGIYVPFTKVYNKLRPEEQFYGKLIPENKVRYP